MLTYWSYTDGICSVGNVMKIARKNYLEIILPFTIVTAVATMVVGVLLRRCMPSERKRISKAELKATDTKVEGKQRTNKQGSPYLYLGQGSPTLRLQNRY